jgi:hypothetical protein
MTTVKAEEWWVDERNRSKTGTGFRGIVQVLGCVLQIALHMYFK